MEISKKTPIWFYVLIFIICFPPFTFAFMWFGSHKIAVYKAKNINNIYTGCLFFEDRVTGKIFFKLDAPNDPYLPKISSYNNFFAVHQFPIYQNSTRKQFKLERGFCNPVKFVSVDFGIGKPYYYVYDISN